jgi:hypothetical protein
LDGVAGQELVYNYTIVASEKTFEYTINPADGDVIDNFSSIVITFPNASTVECDDELEYPVLFETYDEAWYDWSEIDVNVETSGNQVVITAPYATLASGKYNLTISANYIIVDGAKYDKEIFSSFTLQQAVPEFATVIDPAEGEVSSLKTFNIVFKGVDSVLNNDYSSDTKYYIVDKDGNKNFSKESFINYDGEGNPLYIEFNEITTPGEYTLVLPANSYKVNGILGNELTFKYTILEGDGVSAIFADGVENVDVYNLSGVCILKNATRAQVRNLDNNIYIVNGQKYLLRK